MAENFDVQYRVLTDLKETDERAYRIEIDAERIPEDIKKQEAALQARRQDLEQAASQVQECEKKLRSAERELKEKEDSLFKAEGKMMEVKTNEEYQAALKENQVQKQAKSVLEDRVLQLLAEVEVQKTALGEIQKEFKDYERGILAEKAKLSQEHQTLIKELEGFLRRRQELASQLDPSARATYQKILSVGKGVAIAHVEDGRCKSCNLQIRPQIYNEILGHKAIHRCSSCGRILTVSSRLQAEGQSKELSAK